MIDKDNLKIKETNIELIIKDIRESTRVINKNLESEVRELLNYNILPSGEFDYFISFNTGEISILVITNFSFYDFKIEFDKVFIKTSVKSIALSSVREINYNRALKLKALADKFLNAHDICLKFNDYDFNIIIEFENHSTIVDCSGKKSDPLFFVDKLYNRLTEIGAWEC